MSLLSDLITAQEMQDPIVCIFTFSMLFLICYNNIMLTAQKTGWGVQKFISAVQLLNIFMHKKYFIEIL